jgi:hypothetical protein
MISLITFCARNCSVVPLLSLLTVCAIESATSSADFWSRRLENSADSASGESKYLPSPALQLPPIQPPESSSARLTESSAR